MRKRIESYMNGIDRLLAGEPQEERDWEAVRREHLLRISFYQHERLIHFLVTMLVAVLMMLSVGIALIAEYPYMYAVSALFFLLLVPYIRHYFFLENAVQRMYDQYDAIGERLKSERCFSPIEKKDDIP